MARELMTLSEAAEYLRVSQDRLQEMVALRRIRSVGSGQDLRIRKVDLDMWLAQFLDEEDWDDRDRRSDR